MGVIFIAIAKQDSSTKGASMCFPLSPCTERTQKIKRSSTGHSEEKSRGYLWAETPDEAIRNGRLDKKCRWDHLDHSFPRLGKGHESDQQAQQVSPQPRWFSQGETADELRPFGFSTPLTRQVIRRCLRDASQNHLLSLVFIYLELPQQSTTNWLAYTVEFYCLTKMCCLSVMEARSPGSSCQQAGSFWGPWERICSRPLSSACRRSPSPCVSSHRPSSVCVCFGWGTGHNGVGMTLTTSFYFISSVKTLSANKVPFRGSVEMFKEFICIKTCHLLLALIVTYY